MGRKTKTETEGSKPMANVGLPILVSEEGYISEFCD